MAIAKELFMIIVVLVAFLPFMILPLITSLDQRRELRKVVAYLPPKLSPFPVDTGIPDYSDLSRRRPK